MFKITSVSGAPPRTPLGSLRRSPRPHSREGLLAFGNRSFAPSALNPPLAPQKQNSHPVSPPNTKVVGKRGLEKQTKESARHYVIYCVRLGHMFLLVGCGRGARPYVSIMWR